MKTADIKRKNGYYKVFHNNEWRIAYWYIEGQCWFLVGVEKTFNDSEMDIIIETPITFEQTQPVSIGEEVKVKACEFLDSMRAYERESGNSIFYDERTSEELWNIHIGKLDADLNPVEQTQPVPSKEVQENQTYGEFMRSNPEISTTSTTDIENEAETLALKPAIQYANMYPKCNTYDFRKGFEQGFVKSYQMHRNDGLDQLIEWMEWESHRRWNESHELPDFTEILTKANEIKSSLK